MWSNTVANVWFISQLKLRVRGKWRNKIIKSYANIGQISKHYPSFKLDELRLKRKVIYLLIVAFVVHLPGGGYSQEIWVGVCGPLLKTFTLFMTKICDFPYPIYDLTKNLIPYLWPDSSCCWLYVACVAGVKWGNGRQCADGRGRVWWRSCFC